MKSADPIPFYAPDGAALGFRTIEATQRLISYGFVKPSYGRKGHLRAIWLQQENGGNPVEANPQSGTRSSYIETFENGRCWALRRLNMRDDNGEMVSTRDAFFLATCTWQEKEQEPVGGSGGRRRWYTRVNLSTLWFSEGQ